MAVITKTIQAGEKSNEVQEMQKALISLGANIASGEFSTTSTAEEHTRGGRRPRADTRVTG